MARTDTSPKHQDVAPEFASVEAFAEYLFDDERTSFTYDEVAELSRSLRISIPKLLPELATYGLSYEGRERTQRVRGFKATSNRWVDCPTYATSGGDQILGFAGRR